MDDGFSQPQQWGFDIKHNKTAQTRKVLMENNMTYPLYTPNQLIFISRS